MANIKDLKKRIKSTKGTKKITSAMKLVSAAKLAKAQSKILNLRPYSEELSEIVRTVSSITNGYDHEYLNENSSDQIHVLVISSNKGLCGAYNGQVSKKVTAFQNEYGKENVKFHFIGKKVKELVEKDVNVGETFTYEKIEPTHDEVREISEYFGSEFTLGEVGTVFIIYNKFYSAMSCEATVKQVLPMSLPIAEKVKIKEEYPFDFKYEPSAKDILDSTIPEVYINSLYTSILDAHASEHGMRMVAMENATSNCSDVIKKLTLKMNKLRQAAITTELIEVVSGAESLKG